MPLSTTNGAFKCQERISNISSAVIFGQYLERNNCEFSNDAAVSSELCSGAAMVDRKRLLNPENAPCSSYEKHLFGFLQQLLN